MDRRLGVLAFGDSITNGGGELQWGVALQSWALWTARGLGFPYTGCARDGATAHDVVARQIPVFLATAADPGARFDAGLLYIGVNDVRGPDWDAGRVRARRAARRSRSCGSAASGCWCARSRSASAVRGRRGPDRGGQRGARAARGRAASATCATSARATG